MSRVHNRQRGASINSKIDKTRSSDTRVAAASRSATERLEREGLCWRLLAAATVGVVRAQGSSGATDTYLYGSTGGEGLSEGATCL